MSVQNVTSKQVLLGCYLQRFTASFGFNSTPSIVECELVPGNPSNAEHVADNATGFISSLATPGNITGIHIGAFNFKGIIQSWTKNYGPQGLTYSVKIADPRIVFDNIPIVCGIGTTEQSVAAPRNVLDAFKFYGNPKDLGITPNGTLFLNIKNYLTSNTVDLYNHKFSFKFNSGYDNTTGLTNSLGIPPWYQIKSDVLSLNQLLQQAASDFNFDYYAYIDPSGYNSTSGVTNYINIVTIERTASPSSEIDNIITACQTSGTLISYQRGQELRTDPTSAIINGARQTKWVGTSSASGDASPNVIPYWGRTSDGSLLLSPSGNQSPVGVVLLDHLTGRNVDTVLSSGFTIHYTKDTITRTDTDSVYPPSLSIDRTPSTTTGYYPFVTTLQAALYSQEAWESVMYELHRDIAQRIGINEQIFRSSSQIQLQTTGTIQAALNFQKISPSGRGNRNPYNETLIEDIYQATRIAAETYWGKQFVVKMDQLDDTFASPWLSGSNFPQAQSIPIIEYHPVESAWSENGTSMPNCVTNHSHLNTTDNADFKDDQGRLKAFISFVNFDTYDGSRAFPYIIDTSILPPKSYFIETNNNKLCIPISCQAYEKYPIYSIVTLSQPIQAIMLGSGYTDRQPLFDFLSWWGFTESEIINNLYINQYSDGANFGLAPLRPIFLDCSLGNYGIFIPVEFVNSNYGPWTAYGSRPGPVSMNNDNDFAPWTFGSIANMESAANQSVAKYHSDADIIDSAELVIAGLPLYNLGQNIGANSNITSISLQYGPQGLVTNYGIKTFTQSHYKVTKIIQDKITNVFNKTNYDHRNITNIDEQTSYENAFNYYEGNVIPIQNRFNNVQQIVSRINYLIGVIQ